MLNYDILNVGFGVLIMMTSFNDTREAFALCCSWGFAIIGGVVWTLPSTEAWTSKL
jgi:hypothetical protein